MSKSLTIVLALSAGLAGGLLSRYVAPTAAHAQNPQQTPKEVRAQSFVLVDSADRPVGTFTSEPAAGAHLMPSGPGNEPITISKVRIVLCDALSRVSRREQSTPSRYFAISTAFVW